MFISYLRQMQSKSLETNCLCFSWFDNTRINSTAITYALLPNKKAVHITLWFVCLCDALWN